MHVSCGRAHVWCRRDGWAHMGPAALGCVSEQCERARRQEPVLRAHVLTVCEPPPPAAAQAPPRGLPVSWEPRDPEGGKLLLADVAKMDWIYLD